MKISAENRFLAKVVVFVWVAALLSYLGFTIMKFSSEERRTDSVMRRIEDYYARPGSDPEVLRHAIRDLLRSEQRDSEAEEFLLHLAVSLFVAGALIVSVDFAMRNMSQRENEKRTNDVSTAIWRALLNRFVPGPISLEIEGILKSSVCRLKPRYTIKILRDQYRGIPDGYLVVRRELSYQIRNLTPDAIPEFQIRVQLEATPDAVLKNDTGQEVPVPAVRALLVDGKSVPISDPKNVSHSVLLRKMTTDEESLPVYSACEELIPKSGQATYIVALPSVGLEVRIENELRHEIHVKEVYITCGWVDKLKAVSPDQWIYDGGVLPGTVLIVRWEPGQTPTHIA